MAGTERYFIGPKLLGEIRETVSRVAGTPDQVSGASQPIRLQELPRRGGGGGGFRIATFTGAWPIGSSRVVTYKYVQPATTVTATNLFADITGCDTRDCAIASEGGTWFLVATQCQ